MQKVKGQVIKAIEDRVSDFESKYEVLSVGRVVAVQDGVAIISGLSSGRVGEIVEFSHNINGVLLNLKKGEAGAIIFGKYEEIKEGDLVKNTGKILSISASNSFLGRVIDPLGFAVDGKGKIVHKNPKEMLIEKIAPGIALRQGVDTPLQTGIKAIDAMIPIGRGQRELIIGDRNTGKTALAVDTLINQSKLNKEKKAKKVYSIYVAIGQKQSKIAQIVNKLEEEDCLDDTIIVTANSSDAVALQYIAPYAGCAIAEYFMAMGEDVLIVFDDLTKHAWSYRQISLILRRPSGREAYPGDIFYLHSRLLERACKLSKEEGGGSITALPIIETQAQDISAFIPTNVISITDGQIYLESDLFYQGIRPAVNVGLSVSRVGGAAQLKAVKQVAGRLRLELAQFNELSAFAQFGSDLDEASKNRIDRGQRIIEILKQPQYQPIPVERQVLLIWFVTRGYLDTVNLSESLTVANDFVDYALAKYPGLKELVYSEKGFDEAAEKRTKEIAESFIKKSN